MDDRIDSILPEQGSALPCDVARECPTKSKHDVGWRRIVRNFTPSWFSVNMGTGIVSLLLNSLPYNARWLYWISVVIFALNVLLFTVGVALSALRYILYPQIFRVMITHPVQSLFLGTIPMGLATIINMFCDVCVPSWGDGAAYFAWALWILDALLSVFTATVLPFIMMTRKNETHLGSMTAVWLLPIVSCVVAAASGAIVADVLPNSQLALGTIVASFVLWGIGVPLAFMVVTIYLHRLMLHKLPPKAAIVSVFLPLGPLGQGGFGIQKLGKSAEQIFPQTRTLGHPTAGVILSVCATVLALILWGFGLVWLILAVATIVRTRRFPFNLGWWAFTFPLGVYALCTCELGRELPSSSFSIIGTILSLSVVILWALVTAHTFRGILKGNIFFAPCLADLEKHTPPVSA